MRHLMRMAALAMLLLIVFGAVPVLQGTASAEARYYIEVDITNQYVTIYRNSDKEIVRQMICSTGTNATPTPTGTFIMPPIQRSSERQKWYTFSDCYGQYASRIKGGYLFHSYLFSSKKDSAVIKSSVTNLGKQASHGCVRLRIADAKWIADNCPPGTKVKIFKSGKRDNVIRQLLLSETFSASDGKTYAEWASIGKSGELGRGSTGSRVKQVQERLVGMGYADMAADGIYGQLTIDAVKAFQKAANLDRTGVVNDATWAALFGDSAPEGSVTPALYAGTSGAKVKRLQEALVTLKLFAGTPDGVYGTSTANAVKFYQRTHGLSQNGTMSAAMFKNAVSEATALLAQFGDQEYELVKTDNPVAVAKVNVKNYTYLRKTASSSGKALVKLKKNAVTTLISKGKTWTKVTASGKTGYVKTSYLKFYTENRERWEYRLLNAPDITPEPTTDVTLEPTVSPTPDASPTPIPDVSPTPDATPTPTPTPTPDASPTPSASPTPETTTPAPEVTSEPTSSATDAATEPPEAPET